MITINFLAHLQFMRQQFLRRRRSIIGWIIIWTLLGMLFASVFKTLSASAADSSKIFEALPPAVLKTVNIATDYLTAPEKFLSGQFLTVHLLAGSIFSVFMGVGAIGAKIQDKTIFNYLTKPISRPAVYVMQALVNVVSIIIMTAGVGLTMYIAFQLFSGADISAKYILALCAGAALIFCTFALFAQLAGTVLASHRAQALGSALAVASFFINGLGSLAGAPEWMQKVSVYYYFNTIELRDYYTLDESRAVVLAGLIAFFLVLGALIFRRKDLHL